MLRLRVRELRRTCSKIIRNRILIHLFNFGHWHSVSIKYACVDWAKILFPGPEWRVYWTARCFYFTVKDWFRESHALHPLQPIISNGRKGDLEVGQVYRMYKSRVGVKWNWQRQIFYSSPPHFICAKEHRLLGMSGVIMYDSCLVSRTEVCKFWLQYLKSPWPEQPIPLIHFIFDFMFQLNAPFLYYIYHIPLHVSSNFMLIIRRIHCIHTASGSLYVTLLRWPLSAQAVRGLFTERSPKKSDIQRTRCCMYTMNPPDDEHKVARNM